MVMTLFNRKINIPSFQAVVGKAKTVFNRAKHLAKAVSAVEQLLADTRYSGLSKYKEEIKTIEKYASGAEKIAEEFEKNIEDKRTNNFGIQSRPIMERLPTTHHHTPPPNYTPRTPGEEFALRRRREMGFK